MTQINLSSWPNAIIHIDGDAFFASCEQSIHPEYKGKPLITGQERNIVASMSYEAKHLGIKRGVPLWKAKEICPKLIILPSDYETYSLISKRMFDIMRRFTPDVEEASIDEGYADLKGLRRFYRSGYDGIARMIHSQIERELNLSISVGLSTTKTLAKLAAKFKKPHGFTVVKASQIEPFLKHIPVHEVCGIGPNTTALLKKHSVHTAYEYIQKPNRWIQKLLGKIGIELWHELRGDMMYALNTEAKTTYQSVSKSKTFTPSSNDYRYIKAHLLRNAESACIKLRRYYLRAKRIIVYLRTHDFKSFCLQTDISRSSASPIELFPVITNILEEMFIPDLFYRTTGIVLTHLETDGGVQFELFEDPVRVITMNRLSHSVDMINKKYGKHSVHAAAGLFLKHNKKTPAEREGRHAVAKRKTDLLPGETARKRINVPIWNISI